MADLSDVEKALDALITGWAYPNGTAQPSALQGAIPVKVGRGWPTADGLKADLAARVAHVSVYSAPGSERQTTRYSREWQTLTEASPTITAAITGSTITLGGKVTAPQLVAVLAYGEPVVYAAQPADTLATIAAGLVALISLNGAASSSGPALTVPTPRLGVSVGGFGTIWRELRRQERLVQVTIWCATPEQRDVVASFVDAHFAGAGTDNGLEFINLADGSAARLTYARTAPTDADQLSGAFRRDLIYSVEYATTETRQVPQVVAFVVDASANGAPLNETVSVAQVVTTPIVVTPSAGGQLDFSDSTNSGLIAPVA